jgi:hypothetical protein
MSARVVWLRQWLRLDVEEGVVGVGLVCFVCVMLGDVLVGGVG